MSKLVEDRKKVIVVSNTPESKSFGEKKLNRFDQFIFNNRRLPTKTELINLEKLFYKDSFGKNNVNNLLKSVVSEFNSEFVSYVSRADYMCDYASERCFMYFDDSKDKVLWDYGHLTTGGAKQLADLVDRKKWLFEYLYDN